MRDVGQRLRSLYSIRQKDESHEHCEAANRSTFNQDALDWLEELWD